MVSAIVVAGGQGTRMGTHTRKQYLLLQGLPVLAHTLQAVAACRAVGHIYLVVPGEDLAYCRRTLVAPLASAAPVTLVAGGAERQASVYAGLLAVDAPGGIVAIHDGVRPFATPAMFAACIAGARESGACIAGIPAADTLKRVSGRRFVEATLPRQRIWMAQTPQAFRYELLRAAHEAALRDGVVGTDDAELVERLGAAVRLIPGSRLNLKITTPEDLQLAAAVLSGRSADATPCPPPARP